MDLETASSTVSLPTDWTLEWLLTSMNKLVCLEMALRDESFAAIFKVTNKWSLSCMYP